MSKVPWWDDEDEDEDENLYESPPALRVNDSFQTDERMMNVDRIEHLDSKTGDYCVKSGDEYWMICFDEDDEQWRGLRQVSGPEGE